MENFMQNIGIYYLEFKGVYYIGRSNNLTRRYKDHLSSLSKGVGNFKMLEAYEKYGIPNFGVLEYCTIEELGAKEIAWIKEFNSIDDGLNITSGGDGGGSGTTHNRAIHSKEDITKVFELLVKEEALTYTEISKITGVSVSTITNICDSSSHIWLMEAYPDTYGKLSSITLRELRKNNALLETASKLKGIKKSDFKYPDLIDPMGTIHTSITNAKLFAETHNLTTEGICRLFSGKIKSHRKWKLKG